MQSPQAKLKQVRRILALWPSQAADEGEELLRGYLLAVEDYPAQDVERAVDQLIKGTAPGVNPSFRPKPSETGAECRRQMDLRLRAEDLERRYRPQLPPPDIERTPESQARVRAMVAELVGRISPDAQPETEAQTADRKKWQDRMDARFAPPQDGASMRQRLGFEVGDFDGDRDVA